MARDGLRNTPDPNVGELAKALNHFTDFEPAKPDVCPALLTSHRGNAWRTLTGQPSPSGFSRSCTVACRHDSCQHSGIAWSIPRILSAWSRSLLHVVSRGGRSSI